VFEQVEVRGDDHACGGERRRTQHRAERDHRPREVPVPSRQRVRLGRAPQEEEPPEMKRRRVKTRLRRARRAAETVRRKTVTSSARVHVSPSRHPL
jgi:hypothetical protein